MEEVNTDQIVENDGGAPCQLAQSQLQSMTVSLNRGGTTTTDTVQRVKTTMDYNTVESRIDDLRSVARHQAEQADVKLPIETTKSAANIIDDVSRQNVAKHCYVQRQRRPSNHVRLTAIPSDEVDVENWKIVSSGVNQHERYQSFADTQVSKEVPMLTTRTTNQSQKEHGHRKNAAILNTTCVLGNTLVTITDMEE